MVPMGLFQPWLQVEQLMCVAELVEWDQQRNSDVSKSSTPFCRPIAYAGLAEVTHYFIASAPNRNCGSA